MLEDEFDLKDHIAKQREILAAHRERLQFLERRAAQQGYNTPPEVLSEINSLTARIPQHEAELSRLKTEAAVNKEPRAEVEYRMLVAEAWDVPAGRPSVAAATRLEYHRLRLGVLPERAQQIEHEIRSAIAEELFRQVHPRFYHTRSYTYTWSIQKDTNNPVFSEAFNLAFRSASIQNLKIVVNIEYPQLYYEKDKDSINAMVRCIYLDYATTLKMYIEHFTEQPLTITGIQFEPDIHGSLKEVIVPFAEFINRPELAYNLFLDFRQQLFHSFYATRVKEEHKQIGKFIDEAYQAVTEKQTANGRYIPHRERKY